VLSFGRVELVLHPYLGATQDTRHGLPITATRATQWRLVTVIFGATGRELLLEAVRHTNNRKLLTFVALILAVIAVYLVNSRAASAL
jgi:dolichyl-phosphate-mannose--protein O-mannosyl transferase